MRETTITVTLRVCGDGSDDYGVVTFRMPTSGIDWSLADAPRDRVTLADVYQVDLAVGLPDDAPETDTWDRA